MNKLHLKGGRETERETPAPSPEKETGKTPAANPAPPPQKDGGLAPVTEAELQQAWEKLEGYHPLTKEALGEVLEAFLESRR